MYNILQKTNAKHFYKIFTKNIANVHLQVIPSDDSISIASAELTLPHIAKEVLRRKALAQIRIEVSKVYSFLVVI